MSNAVALSQLPPPPPARTGWPWTEESKVADIAMSDGRPWPRFTIVTPSFNQAEYLEATIRSVLLQGYPDLAYAVIDGGSADGSAEIIAKYAPWLAYWVSEHDRGQSHAINKGFARSSGEIQGWLNSDDAYYANTLQTAAQSMPPDCDILIGAMDKVALENDMVRVVKTSTPHTGVPLHRIPVLAAGRRADFHFIQPPMFWRRDLWRRTGGLDERYHYSMDVEWCSRALALGARVRTTDAVFARFMVHPAAKTQAFYHRQLRELAMMYLRLSRLPGFHRMRCLAASVRPARRACAMQARRSRGARAASLRACGLGLAAIERVMRVTWSGVSAESDRIAR